MLVLTRRSKDKISFPQVGITVHFIRVQSGHVKIGVDAPRDIAIVRDEVDQSDAAAELVRRQLLRLPREIRHGIRNELHEISVGLHLYKELVSAGLEDEAAETFTSLQEALLRLDGNEVLRRPDQQPVSIDSSASIVLLDDDVNQREMLAGFLRLKGYRVVGLTDGEQAMEYFSDNDLPGVVLIDIEPQCDGATAVRELRSIERFNNTPIFAISGTSPEDFGLQIGPAGIDRWFPKPLNAKSLIEAIDRSLGGHRGAHFQSTESAVDAH